MIRASLHYPTISTRFQFEKRGQVLKGIT